MIKLGIDNGDHYGISPAKKQKVSGSSSSGYKTKSDRRKSEAAVKTSAGANGSRSSSVGMNIKKTNI